MRRLLGIFVLTLGLSACGGHAAKQASYPAEPEQQAYGQPGGYPQSGAPPATRSYSGSEMESADEGAPMAESAAPESRPGLGTSWGETRTSRVRDVHFYRDQPDTPDAVTMLYYNDANGVRAMTRGFASIGDSVVSVDNGAFTIQLLDSSGNPLPGLRHRESTYAIGEDGERYTIRIDNHTRYRAEIVVTVDGLDVVDGEPGDFSKRGYVIDAFDRLEIDGFRQSSDEVATFRFGSVDDSYAERRGMGRNVGVIGVAFFSERGSRWDSWSEDEVYRRRTASPFPGRFAPPPPPRSWR